MLSTCAAITERFRPFPELLCFNRSCVILPSVPSSGWIPAAGKQANSCSRKLNNIWPIEREQRICCKGLVV